MALTVGTNTYITVDDANTYFGDRLYVDEWTGATDSDKSKALLMARRNLDQQGYIGCLADSDQPLQWPRKNIPNVDSDTVPQAIIDAQCELALAFLREDLTADDGTRGIAKLQAGSVVLEYDGRAPEKRLPDTVLAQIRRFLAEPVTTNSVAMVF